MTGPVAGVLGAGGFGLEEGEKEVAAEGNKTRKCTKDTFLCVLSLVTMRSSNYYPILQIIQCYLLIFVHILCFPTHLTFVILPPCEGSRASAMLSIWARAVP